MRTYWDRDDSERAALTEDEVRNSFKTQFFSGSSIYRETPCTEEVARAVAQHARPTPIHSWEMPRPALPPASETEVDAGDCAEVHDAECSDEDDGRPF